MTFRLQASLRFLAPLLLWALSPCAHADWLLAMPQPRVIPGEAFELVVVGEPEASGWPQTLSVTIKTSHQAPRIAVQLNAVSTRQAGQQRYIGQWPGEVTGLATLILKNPTPGAEGSPTASTAHLLVKAIPKRLPDDPLQSAIARALPVQKGESTDTLDSALDPTAHAPDMSVTSDTGEKPVEPNPLGFNEPIYFIAGGSNPRSARYQLSFRYRLFDRQGLVGKNMPVANGIYFGFTQTSMWDLESNSKPFKDTSFRPSFFYQWRIFRPTLGDSLAIATGYEHESNGRDGDVSRSIDTWFLSGDLRYHLPDGQTYIGIQPKLVHYFEKGDNRDITDYRGHGQLGLRFGRDSSLMLSAILRHGTKGRGSEQVDLSYPIRRSIFSGVGTFLHLQYFRGYGQTLLEYNESRPAQFRFGLSLVR